MTPNEFVKLYMQNCQYRNEVSSMVADIAKENGLVVVFGASDDLCEIRGAEDDEIDCFDGGEATIAGAKVKINWCKDGYSWTYDTDIPHECFDVYEDGEKYCRGIVFSISDVRLPIMSYKEIGEKGANYALDEVEYNGLTIRQWADKIISGEYAPVRHGHWDVGYFHDRVCSNCFHPSNDFDDRPYHFCPTAELKWKKSTVRAMKIKVKYFADIEPLEKIDKGDWIDLRAAADVTLKKGEYALIPLGVGMILPKDYEAHVAPRSSTYKHFKVVLANSMGIIDNCYCGDNDQWHFPAIALEDTVIHKNDRICQFRIVEKQPPIEFETVEELGDVDRGGLGSTGKN